MRNLNEKMHGLTIQFEPVWYSLLVLLYLAAGMSACSPRGEIVMTPDLNITIDIPTVYVSPTATLAPTETATSIPTMTPTLTPVPSDTPLPTATATPSPSATPEGFRTNPQDGAGLIYIPAGDFSMGSEPDDDPYFWGAERPPHRVYLDEFWIYRTEVTNAMYQACVATQACPLPAQLDSRINPGYFNDPAFADYPVIHVNWKSAAAYCQWAGGRLPTEAEWEKAARGSDGRLFPWGDGAPSGELANYCDRNCPESYADPSQDDGYRENAPVGSYPAGASPYGVLDMAGNVWEWTADWFNETYYRVSPAENPRGPLNGTRRVMRGGSWFNTGDGLRTVARASTRPGETLYSLGFRCAVEGP